MTDLSITIQRMVTQALEEDIGNGDLTADLVPANDTSSAYVIVRESAILCGQDWFNEVFRQLDNTITIDWQFDDGASLASNQQVCTLSGNARALLTGERTALNFLQTLSGTATTTAEYVKILQGLNTRFLDTRKTIPGFRAAQKYAVRCGGGQNHRMGLYDAILIKENHIAAAGSILAVVENARRQSVAIEVEVENLQQLEEALAAGVDSVLLDNFSLDDLRKAVKMNQGKTKLEASGGIDKASLRSIAETGVDYISIGALTKHLRAIDFSMRFE